MGYLPTVGKALVPGFCFETLNQHLSPTVLGCWRKMFGIILRKRNTTKVFLTGFEFLHLCEAEDMDSVVTL